MATEYSAQYDAPLPRPYKSNLYPFTETEMLFMYPLKCTSIIQFTQLNCYHYGKKKS